MFRSAIAILSYNRWHALRPFVESIDAHCPQYPRAIFEDCGVRDDTTVELKRRATTPVVDRHDLLADQFMANFTATPSDLASSAVPHQPWQVFLGQKNLGVAGNSNRAIRWFMEETKADHLCLLNDDLVALGDFVDLYWKAHCKLNIHLWTFSDFESEQYKGVPFKVRTQDGTEWNLKMLPRMVGMLMSITRKLVEQIGFYDVAFQRFGEEHCCYNNRARFAGGLRMQNQDFHALDVVVDPPVLKSNQEVASSIMPYEKPALDMHAFAAMQKASRLYPYTSWYRPFKLYSPKFAGTYEMGGVPVDKMPGYELVID